MDDKHPLGLGAERIHPGQQALAVGMARKARQLTDLCLHVDGLTEQLDIDGTIDQGAPQRSHGLIAHKKDRALRPPQIVLEVVADAACLAHAAGRDDDLGHRSALIIRDSSLVTLTCSPGNWMGSMPWASSARVSSSKQSGRYL